MVASLAVFNEYLEELLARGSSTMEQVCLPVWEADFFTFESSVLVSGFVPLCKASDSSNEREFCKDGF